MAASLAGIKPLLNWLAYCCIALGLVTSVQGAQEWDNFRPKLHYSVQLNWLNDPNGLVFVNGEYHMYYQYHPGSSVPGPKSWAHTISRDFVTWSDLPTALEPDELGDIWSGSSIVDFTNSSGFQTNVDVYPIVAVFTHAGQSQQQSIAYSNDWGRTFTKFAQNPVIPNPGKQDFRDPKVIWYNDESWILVLAAGDRVEFYISQDLKNWSLSSDFGADPDQGLKGVWECPDIFPLEFDGETVWVLLVSNGGGGPNGGSNTQYFVGTFDGTTFSSPQIDPLFMDSGVDNYASISFFNEPRGRRVIIGWMTNLMYANDIPTGDWRGQMTMAREVRLAKNSGNALRLRSLVVDEIVEKLVDPNQEISVGITGIAPDTTMYLTDSVPWNNSLMHLNLFIDVGGLCQGCSLSICFLNSKEQEICSGYDHGRERPLFLDRERSGRTDFNPSFSRRLSAIREIPLDGANNILQFEAFLDLVAIEVFFDGGMTPMTSLFYPEEPYTFVEIRHHALGNINSRLSIASGSVFQGMKSMYEV
ncbi:levanase [Folsomia candida]|uniref:levanase n=1 Tax=Folsomia candida TaxID=158441 RepID=UPI000B8FD5BD|nr:levanase [Folsomia candida]